jgi:hypothetical protein
MAKKQTSSHVDWGRVEQYLLGRSTLIGIAAVMLLLISGYATWHGMRDFIIGVSGSGSHDSGSGLSIPNDLLVVIVVVALTLPPAWPRGWRPLKLCGRSSSGSRSASRCKLANPRRA